MGKTTKKKITGNAKVARAVDPELWTVISFKEIN
jgi:hypothetical protein